MSHLPHAPLNVIDLNEGELIRTDDEPYVSPEREGEPDETMTELETARASVKVLGAAYEGVSKSLIERTLERDTAHTFAKLQNTVIEQANARADALQAQLDAMRGSALLARDCRRNGDVFGADLQCGLILNALLGADAVDSAPPGVALRGEGSNGDVADDLGLNDAIARAS